MSVKEDEEINNGNDENRNLRIIDDDYGRLLQQEEKKKKTLRDKIFLELKRKRVQKKTISEIQSIINQVIKQKANTPEQIASIMQQRGLKRNEEVINIASLVMSTKIVNDRIVLSDRISEKPLFTYYTTYVPELSALTNDVLYLWYIYYKDIQEDVGDEQEKKEFKKYMLNKCKLENVGIVSAPMVLGGDIKKGYYQDYSGQYLALNLDNIDEEERNKILDLRSSKDEFIYLDTKYNVSGNREACVIYIEKDKGKIKEMYKNMKILKAERNKIELEEKVLPIKKRPKFLSCKLKGERFCPCYIIFPKKINIACLYKIRLDNNAVFEQLEKNMKKNVFSYPRNICYWNELDSFVDFMWVFSLTSRTIDPNFKKNLIDILVLYEKNKPAFQMWKTVQLEYQRLLYDFYNSFNTRIKYDKLMSIYNKMTEHINARASLIKDGSYNDVINFFKFFGDMAEYINRQFTPKCQIAADQVVSALSKLDNGKIKDINEIKETGILIYFLSDTPDYDKYMYPSFPFILSPGAFLGNIIDKGMDDIEDNFIEEIIENHNKNKEKIDNDNKMAIENMSNIVDDVDKYIKQVLNNNTDAYLKEIGIKKKDQITHMKEAVIIDAFNNNELLKEIKGDIIAKTLISRPLKEINLRNNQAFTDIVDNIINTANIEKEKEDIKKNLKTINIKKDINNLQNELNKIDNYGRTVKRRTQSKSPEIDTLKAGLSLIGKKITTGNKKKKFKDTFSVATNTVIGQNNFTDSDNLADIIIELEKMNDGEEGIYTDDNLLTINKERVPSRVLDYLKTCYLIAASNAGIGKPELVQRKQTLGWLTNQYKLKENDLKLGGKNYNMKKEINSLHMNPKYRIVYPYAENESFRRAIKTNTKAEMAEPDEEESEEIKSKAKEEEEEEEDEKSEKKKKKN